MRRTATVAAGTVWLALSVALVVGIPAALVRFVGWPGPTGWPTLDQLARISQAGISDTTVIKTLAVIVWMAWAQLTVALTVETVAAARNRAARALPLAPGLQPLAARVVAGIALLATVTAGPRPALAVPLDAAVAAAPAVDRLDLQPADIPDQSGPTDRQTRPAATETIVTGQRDSWWSLAERHLGDGLRWRQLRDLNIGRTVTGGGVITADTDRLAPGWPLLIPTPDTTHPDTAAASPGPQPPETDGATWQVQSGDHFWKVAEEQLTETWGRQPETDETAAYWRTLVDANRDRLAPPGDPDLIYPDQTLLVPPAPADPTTPTDPPPAPDQTTTARSLEPSPTEAPAATNNHAEAGPGAPEQPPPDDTVQATGQSRWRQAVEHTHPDTTSPPADNTEDGSDPDVEDDGRTGLGVPAGLTGGLAAAGLLAAGVVATIAWRRRVALYQRLPALQLPTPLPEVDEHVARLHQAQIPEPVLDDLAHLLATVPTDVHPVLVTTGDDGTVRLLFDDTDQVPDPPAPWQPVDDDGAGGPVGWTAHLGDRGPERSVGLPLLVTLGRTGTTTVHANLGGIGRLNVTGPDAAVRRRLRAMSLQAATTRIAIPVTCAVVGDGLLAGLEPVLHVDDPAEQIRGALDLLEQDVVDDDRTTTLLACHQGAPVPELPEQLTGQLAIIAGNPPQPDGWTLVVATDTAGRLQLPDGGYLELELPDVDPQLIDTELTRLDRDATPPDGSDQPAERTAAATTATAAADLARTEPAFCEVRLLGDVQVLRDGYPVDGLTPKILEVLTYLVTHRDGVTKERLGDAVWAGRAARPGSQRVTSALTKLRALLGDGPDGQPLVPRRTDATQPIRLSRHVCSDLDRAFAHLAVADELPGDLRTDELTAALELVRGEPFQDLPVSWATEVTQRAIIQLQDAALEVAATRREQGDYDAAVAAVEAGLKLLDPADALYLELAETEKARGRPDRISQIWKQLRQAHANDADEIAGSISLPAPEIELAFQDLGIDPTGF